jgi:hypothetical protein
MKTDENVEEVRTLIGTDISFKKGFEKKTRFVDPRFDFAPLRSAGTCSDLSQSVFKGKTNASRSQ